jgi:hypothetical protein
MIYIKSSQRHIGCKTHAYEIHMYKIHIHESQTYVFWCRVNVHQYNNHYQDKKLSNH